MNVRNASSRCFGSMLLASFALLLSSHLGSEAAQPVVIYAASGSNGVSGTLYTLNRSTGAATPVGALVDTLGKHYGLTGLAFDPVNGTLYGSTANSSPTAAQHLVRVNPATALITDIGSFGIGSTLSDITFTSDETLYGWSAAGSHSMYRVNLTTGAATLVGSSGVGGGFGGGGLAANSANVIYATPDSSTNPPGTLRTVSRTTGVATTVATLSGAPLLSGGGNVIDAMAFDDLGNLLGINNTDTGSNPSSTHLVKINTSTGAITDIGASASNLDALAVQFTAVPSAVPAPPALVLVGLGLAGLVGRRLRSRFFTRSERAL